MRTLNTITLALLATFCLTVSAGADTFSSGSDGSLGALDVTEDMTLQIPDDGVFNYTTFSVQADATLTFSKNANWGIYTVKRNPYVR